ncbi:MAG TPA: ferredoxin [Candidatus Hydrogenedentes bacterium]|nr:ferredoxin [Candidatus Hydrogenedentota bacterium]HQE82634.1 ferredoxin [Candidatus Hydrogenedentota bacterium]HQH67357.1 ferredoxin [Candidatus Hydrogenedentota bacterium]HQM48413.1 ferredoxin [Candidatus Hydrogenedentota bacterium]
MSGNRQLRRRDFIRVAAAAGAGGIIWKAAAPAPGDTVWQLDPQKCVQCGRCATECVLSPSAVKCVHSYRICGYCDLCGGYLQATARKRDTGAENELCPVSAIKRTFIEDPFFQYTIDEALCVGCGKCVKGCALFGNGSLYLQVKQELCVHCNECAIARSCPAGAYRRIPAEEGYLLKTRPEGGSVQE